MIGGDISNEVSPRVLVVWEGVLTGPRPGSTRGGLTAASRLRSLVAAYQHDLGAVSALARLWRRTAVRIDVATFLPAGAGDLISRRLEEDFLPHSLVREYADRQALVASLPLQHDLIAVYDTQEHALMYGGLGQTLDQLARLA